MNFFSKKSIIKQIASFVGLFTAYLLIYTALSVMDLLFLKKNEIFYLWLTKNLQTISNS